MYIKQKDKDSVNVIENKDTEMMIIPLWMYCVVGVLATAEEGCKCWKQWLGPQLFSCSRH